MSPHGITALSTRSRTLTVTTALLLTAAAAAALPATQANAAQRDDSRQHCVVSTSGGAPQCYASFTEAVERATGGRVTDAPADAREAVRDDDFRTRTRQLAGSRAAQEDGEVIQGTFFEDSGYGGADLTIYGEGLCDGDKDSRDWRLDQLPEGWDDRITSLQPWSNCEVWLHSEPELNGDKDGPFKSQTPDIGSIMNDRTRSIGFN
ncbi:hypothetical protein [Streptomyces sp. NPDC005438]|uniref:hypothetical protein n=1 Tax=Streptomyces sp. NPDC005438 TaxID=3156880 RepID=UPI0033ACC2AB